MLNTFFMNEVVLLNYLEVNFQLKFLVQDTCQHFKVDLSNSQLKNNNKILVRPSFLAFILIQFSF